MEEKSNNALKERCEKFYKFYDVLVKWMTINQNKRYISDYLIRHSYKRIVIYGMKELGMLLYDEIINAGLSVEYVIDKNADFMNIDIEAPMFSVEDEWPEADLIIVTAVYNYEEIFNEYKDKASCPIVSLEEIIRLS